jgi:hypothetical protein
MIGRRDSYTEFFVNSPENCQYTRRLILTVPPLAALGAPIVIRKSLFSTAGRSVASLGGTGLRWFAVLAGIPITVSHTFVTVSIPAAVAPGIFGGDQGEGVE